jgi:hypothetical protein
MSAKTYSVQQDNKALIAPPLPEAAQYFFTVHETNAGRINPIKTGVEEVDQMWRALSEEDKVPFKKQAVEDQARWERQAAELKKVASTHDSQVSTVKKTLTIIRFSPPCTQPRRSQVVLIITLLSLSISSLWLILPRKRSSMLRLLRSGY